jgi:hypothetical protein
VAEDVRAIRAAKNEDLFREVNERIEEISTQTADESFEALCECTDATCHEVVPLARTEYEAVRATGTRFVVVPGHDTPPIERIVKRSDRYWVIEKTGKAAKEAEKLDPRQ